MNAQHTEPDIEFIGNPEVQKATNLGRTQIWKLENTDPTFPKSIHLGRRKVFVKSEIQTWIRQQIAARNNRVAS